MSFESLNNNELMMLHTVLHKNYSDKSMDMDKLKNFHISVIMEMNKRGLQHLHVDKLDD